MKKFFYAITLFLLPIAVFCNNVAAPKVQSQAQSPERTRNFDFVTKLNKADGIFKKNEVIEFSAKLLENGSVPQGMFLQAQLYFNEKLRENKVIPANEEVTFKVSSGTAGWFVLRLTVLDENKKILWNVKNTKKFPYRGGIGAMVAPEEIMPGAPEPADFDAFWQKQRAELDKVPVKAVRTSVPVPKQYAGKVLCWDVKVDCAGGMPVSGYLCMPANAKPKSLPIQVSYHGAGVRSSNKPLPYGQYAISFNVNAHGIANGQPAAFYQKLAANELKGYPGRNKTNRDDFYFRGMYLRLMRALDYVKSLPEWNGKILVVTGGSQGGAQALVAAALDPQVTFCGANVPALCDHGGGFADRAAGWPRLYKVRNGKADNEKVMQTAGYYDCCNFAKRIKCETYVCTGFADGTCVPTSVYAAFNSLPKSTVKTLFTNPAGTHSMKNPGLGKRVYEMLQKR